MDHLDGQLPPIAGELAPCTRIKTGQCHGEASLSAVGRYRIVRLATRRHAEIRRKVKLALRRRRPGSMRRVQAATNGPTKPLLNRCETPWTASTQAVHRAPFRTRTDTGRKSTCLSEARHALPGDRARYEGGQLLQIRRALLRISSAEPPTLPVWGRGRRPRRPPRSSMPKLGTKLRMRPSRANFDG